MIDVDLLSVIRRWHGRDKLPIREIARRTGLSRNTIKKYLSSGEVSPKYPARKSISKLDPYAETLASWLDRTPGFEPRVMWEIQHIRPLPLRTLQAVSCPVNGAA